MSVNFIVVRLLGHKDGSLHKVNQISDFSRRIFPSPLKAEINCDDFARKVVLCLIKLPEDSIPFIK